LESVWRFFFPPRQAPTSSAFVQHNLSFKNSFLPEFTYIWSHCGNINILKNHYVMFSLKNYQRPFRISRKGTLQKHLLLILILGLQGSETLKGHHTRLNKIWLDWKLRKSKVVFSLHQSTSWSLQAWSAGVLGSSLQKWTLRRHTSRSCSFSWSHARAEQDEGVGLRTLQSRLPFKKNHRITAWSGLEGTSVGHPVQPSCQSRVTYSRL